MDSADNSSDIIVANSTLFGRKISRKIGKNKNVVKLHKPMCGNSSRIKLCWPEDKKSQEMNYNDVPSSYTSNNEKEKIILWHAENFRNKINSKYPNRAPILLAATNEYGIQKMVCSFLRPTSLPFSEMGDWKGIANFVADHVKLEPLQEPTQLENKSDDMDYSVSSIYEVKPRKQFESKFLNKMQEQEQHRIEKELQKKREEEKKRIEEEERLPPDELHGRRVHCWILVLPGEYRSDVHEPFYIEPSSGKAYEINNPDFMGVEAVWNHENYWFNIQTNIFKTPNYKVEDKNYWMPFLDEEVKKLDMPKSWMEKVAISREAYDIRYPGGSKTVLYKRSKLELFSELSRSDGLVLRVTCFSDLEWCDPLSEILEFKHRKDCLVKSLVETKLHKINDFYQQGRDDYVKEHEYYESCDQEVEKKIDFYNSSHPDGLVRRHIKQNLVIEDYDGHNDCHLTRREMQFSSKSGKLTVEVTIENFQCDETNSIPPEKQVAQRKFFHIENKIFIKYHHAPNQITAGYLHFLKPTDDSKFGVEHIHNYEPNNADEMQENQNELKIFIQKQFEDEEKVISHAGTIHNKIRNLLDILKKDRNDPGLQTSVYDEQRNQELVEMMKLKEQEKLENSMKELIDHVDPLAPLLERRGHAEKLSQNELSFLQEECNLETQQYYKNMKQYLTEQINKLESQLQSNKKTAPQLSEEEIQSINLQIQALQFRLSRVGKDDE